jgi:transposase
MGQKSEPAKEPAEQVPREIRRSVRRQSSAEEKVRIVLSGLPGETVSLSCATARGLSRTSIIAGRRNFWRPARSAWPVHCASRNL